MDHNRNEEAQSPPPEVVLLDKQFTYHPPKDGQPARYSDIRARGFQLALAIMRHCPACADRSAAIRKVREAVMTANAAIALED